MRSSSRHAGVFALVALTVAAVCAGLSGGGTVSLKPLPIPAGSPTAALAGVSGSPSLLARSADGGAGRVVPLPPGLPVGSGAGAVAQVRSLAAAVAKGGRGGGAAVLPRPLGGGDLGIPPLVLAAYRAAQRRIGAEQPGCHLGWPVLAGIGRVESDHGRQGGRTLIAPDGTVTPTILGPVLDGSAGTAAIPDTDRSTLDGDPRWDRAVGPMQFIPSTWRASGRDGNGDGRADPDNVYDAALAAAGYLCRAGADLRDPARLAAAIRAYNPSD
ncbi:MAG TPA: lytic murein transglycosylase, partial [Frankiaceae bacterium]|nr:lytic murein transglycosylase [Frankiaceae bacterium]